LCPSRRAPLLPASSIPTPPISCQPGHAPINDPTVHPLFSRPSFFCSQIINSWQCFYSDHCVETLDLRKSQSIALLNLLRNCSGSNYHISRIADIASLRFPPRQLSRSRQAPAAFTVPARITQIAHLARSQGSKEANPIQSKLLTGVKGEINAHAVCLECYLIVTPPIVTKVTVQCLTHNTPIQQGCEDKGL
jgi:hypothetical protein